MDLLLELIHVLQHMEKCISSHREAQNRLTIVAGHRVSSETLSTAPYAHQELHGQAHHVLSTGYTAAMPFEDRHQE